MPRRAKRPRVIAFSSSMYRFPSASFLDAGPLCSSISGRIVATLDDCARTELMRDFERAAILDRE